MIYFTEISRDVTGKQEKAEAIAFQFYMKELPESIKLPYVTKTNHIEYNGGFQTNQIMGVFQQEVEWEGCFYGTYQKADGSRYSAKERADEVRKFMGRPIRVGFAMPRGGDEYIPGEDPVSQELGKPGFDIPGRLDNGLGGDVGVYIIAEYEPEIFNYSDVNYRIKLVPHQRQEKIKPELSKDKIKLDIEGALGAVNKIAAAGSGRLAATTAKVKQKNNVLNNMTQKKPEVTREKPLQIRITEQEAKAKQARLATRMQGPTDVPKAPKPTNSTPHPSRPPSKKK